MKHIWNNWHKEAHCRVGQRETSQGLIYRQKAIGSQMVVQLGIANQVRVSNLIGNQAGNHPRNHRGGECPFGARGAETNRRLLQQHHGFL